MSDVAVVECWKITDCDWADRCLVKKYEGKSCWTVASLRDGFEGVNPVCEDCLVYITGFTIYPKPFLLTPPKTDVFVYIAIIYKI